MTCWENKGEAGLGKTPETGAVPLTTLALWGKVLDREETATRTMLDSGQTMQCIFLH